jgi:NADH-quinone oxidoreductase subunit G
MPAADGQVIHTRTEKVKKAREGVMEFLLINHPLDCPICDQGGECDLQDQSLTYGKGASRYDENKRAVTEKYMGPLIKTVMTRCIHCTRCVRFAEEVAGVEEIGAIGRGESMQITSYLEKAVTSEVSGNVIDLCPVGALTSKPYAFQARPWELKKTDSIDVMDAIGSNIVVGSRGAAVLRVTPRLNDDVNEEWLADKSRFAVDGLSERRLDTPWVRVNGKLQKATWAEAFTAVAAGLKGLKGDEIAGIVGDLNAVEEMVALRDLLATLGSTRIESRQDGALFDTGEPANWLFNTGLAGIETADAILLVGTNPRQEAALLNVRLRKAVKKGGAKAYNIGPAVDLSFPITQLGDDAALLTALPADVVAAFAAAQRPAIILGMGALKTPGLYAAARAAAVQLGVVKDGWNGFNLVHTAAARAGALRLGLAVDGGVNALLGDTGVKALFLVGADEVNVMAGRFTVYIGTHGDHGVRHADVILPAAAYTEKPGTYVNMEGRVQRALKATQPPGDARDDWTILRALSSVLGQKLPYDDLSALRRRIAADWPDLARDGLIARVGTLPAVNAAPVQGALHLAYSNYHLTNPVARASATMAACVSSLIVVQEAAK